MDTPGFQGLYGGQENTDEEVLFDRAAQRLFQLSSARRHGRSMSNTPERELSFADDRGKQHGFGLMFAAFVHSIFDGVNLLTGRCSCGRRHARLTQRAEPD